MILNLQFFGGRGASSGTGKTRNKITGYKNIQGKNADELKEITSMKISEFKEYFDINDASNDQVYALKNVLNGILEYDKSYGDGKPFKITDIEIKTLKNPFDDEEDARTRRMLGMRKTKSPITVHITTVPNSDNSYIRMMDTKYRSFFIGAKGGYYTYGKSGKRKILKSFDVRYGTGRL